ncbi:MAG: flagellar biosynthesis protein FlhB [Alphaproteobacteria bacterium]|nr:flagellar biosynthesis protein FlhB [Alphaproteobacteria bacterium]
MAEEDQTDDSQKTEDPTPKKLEEARKKGQVALSREVNNWVMLMAGTLIIAVFSSQMFLSLGGMMQSMIEQSYMLPGAPGGIGKVLSGTLFQVMFIMALPIIILILAAFFAPFLQVGPLFAPEAVKPDLSKISLSKGMQRLFSMRSLMEFAKGLFKIGAIGLVGFIILYPYFDKFEHMIDMSMGGVLVELRILVVKLMVGVLVALMIIAVADLVYQHYEYNKKMRMSRQEIKDEYKQSEGDPQVRAKLRQLRAERSRQRMMQAVPGADVVITNPTHYSIALKYDPDEMPAPVVVAKGIDDIALRIREVAKENDIILYENKPLARVLYDTVEIDETIPIEHFKAVAEIISYVFKLKGKLN